MFFLTGCTGLVGSFLAIELLKRNFKVRALRRSDSDLSLISPYADSIEWIEGDLNDITGLEKALEGVETVIHTAAIVSYSSKKKTLMYQVNVEGTANVVNASLKAGVKKFCHISSVAALSKKDTKNAVNETSDADAPEFTSTYGLTKYLAELEVFRGIEEGLDAFIVNPSIILGPGDWEKSSTKLFKYVWDENKFYTPGFLNYIDIRDVVNISLTLLEKEKITGNRYILNAGTLPYNVFFNLIGEHFDKKTPYIETKRWMAEMAWMIESIKSLFTGKDPLITKETVRLTRRNSTYSNEKIRNLLGYNFTDAKESIRWVCAELEKKYKVRK
jgi:dihydroflavonol-4-reductase